jgi:hypothetical protein
VLIWAARALLAWRQEGLAKAAKIGLATTIARIEQTESPAQDHVSTIIRIQEALKRVGIRFIKDKGAIGVRREKKPSDASAISRNEAN